MPIRPRPGRARWCRQGKSWSSSSAEGCLKARTSTACGLTPLITCLMVLSLPDASSPCRNQEHAVRVLRGEPVLILGEKVHAVGEQGGGLLAGHLAGVARIVVTAQPDGGARRHHERFDEVGHE